MKFIKALFVITVVSSMVVEMACKKPTLTVNNAEAIAPISLNTDLPNAADNNVDRKIVIQTDANQQATIAEMADKTDKVDIDIIDSNQQAAITETTDKTDKVDIIDNNQQATIDKIENLVQPSKSKTAAVLNDINFELDTAAIRVMDKDKLQNIAAFLKANPSIKIQISGNCDERGTIEYNLALGERRAHAARNYLIDLGVDENRLSTISYGKEKPKADGHDEASWFINRNCQFMPR